MAMQAARVPQARRSLACAWPVVGRLMGNVKITNENAHVMLFEAILPISHSKVSDIQNISHLDAGYTQIAGVFDLKGEGYLLFLLGSEG